MTHLYWSFEVDIGAKRLSGDVLYTFERGGNVTLDTHGLEIESVDHFGSSIEFELGESFEHLGAPLRFVVPEDRPRIRICYRTKQAPLGILWLAPAQTTDGKHPFVLSQGEMILTRSYLPCQDTPAIKFTYEARITVPSELRGIMAADAHMSRSLDNVHPSLTTEHWKMTKPVPAYLVAFAVGDIAVRDIDAHVAVYAEPSMVDRAAEEFADVPKMIETAEDIFGIPYDWGRFDPFVMPRGFPWGGMENPSRPFLTPALVVGDKSNVSTVAHELAHSWAGNRVTNATWSDFWLNEGLTTYVEHRIVERLYGVDEMELHLALLGREYQADIERLSGQPDLTTLTPALDGIDPESMFSRVPYYKGALFWFTLEASIGRDMLDVILSRYMERFAFQSVTTEQLFDFLVQEIGRTRLKAINIADWFYRPGIPDTVRKFKAVLTQEPGRIALNIRLPTKEVGTNWNAAQWGYYLALVPRKVHFLGATELASLAHDFGLVSSPNPDVAWAFFQLAVDSNSRAFDKELRLFLLAQGRKKYLFPLYRSLCRSEEGKAFAAEVFAQAKSGYHPVVCKEIEGIIISK